MDGEDLLGWLMAVCWIGVFVYLGYMSMTKDRSVTIEEFRKSPMAMSAMLLSVVGIMMFLLWLVSFGKLAFVVHTPWINIHSGLAGLALGFLALFARKK